MQRATDKIQSDITITEVAVALNACCQRRVKQRIMRWLLESVLVHHQVKMEVYQVLQQVGPIPMQQNKLGHCLSSVEML